MSSNVTNDSMKLIDHSNPVFFGVLLRLIDINHLCEGVTHGIK